MLDKHRYHDILYGSLLGFWCGHPQDPMCLRRYSVTVNTDGGPGYCIRVLDAAKLQNKNFRCYQGCFAENYMAIVSHRKYYDSLRGKTSSYKRRLFVYHYEDVLNYPDDIVGNVDDTVPPRLELEPIYEDLYDVVQTLITGNFKFNILPSWNGSAYIIEWFATPNRLFVYYVDKQNYNGDRYPHRVVINDLDYVRRHRFIMTENGYLMIFSGSQRTLQVMAQLRIYAMFDRGRQVFQQDSGILQQWRKFNPHSCATLTCCSISGCTRPVCVVQRNGPGGVTFELYSLDESRILTAALDGSRIPMSADGLIEFCGSYITSFVLPVDTPSYRLLGITPNGVLVACMARDAYDDNGNVLFFPVGGEKSAPYEFQDALNISKLIGNIRTADVIV
mgnify:CR=1 FL=1